MKALFKKAPEDERSGLERRVARLSTTELYRWLDSTLAGIGRLANEARKDANSPLLVEAEEGAVAVQVVLRELQRR